MAYLQKRTNSLTAAITGKTELQVAASYTVMVCKQGATVKTTNSATRIIAVDDVGQFAIDDWFIVNNDTTKFRKVTGVDNSAKTVTYWSDQALITVTAEDRLINLGADTGATSPAYDGGFAIYKDIAGNETKTNPTTTDSSGGYEYWIVAGSKVDELFRNSSGTPVGNIQDIIFDTQQINVVGAKGDGTTDDTAAIQRAIDLASAGMEVALPFPSVRYKISSALTINKAIRFVGVGSSGIRQGDASANGVIIRNTGTGDAIYIHEATSEADQVILENLRIEGNASSRYGVHIATAQNVILRDVFIGHPSSATNAHGSHGLYIAGDSYYNRFYNVLCYRNAGNGVHFAGTVTDNVNENTFYGLVSSNNAGVGLYATYTQSLKLYAPVFEGNTSYGVHIDSNCLTFSMRDAWYEGNGQSNLVYINPGLHASGAGGYLIDGGNYPTGGVHIGTAKYTSIKDANISTLTIDAGADYTDYSGLPTYTVITDNGAHTGFYAKNAVLAGVLDVTGLAYFRTYIRNLNSTNVLDIAPANADAVKFLVPTIQTISTLANSATPSVTASSVYLTGGTTTITNFTNGVTGQIITVISEHAITITDGTNIFLSGSANFVMAATDTLTLICKADGKWYEVSRSDNT